ncbi:hypothetical protein KZZ52_52960 [Dactylosporangium sp. AC04546]|uniref:hypothetical protein n=1 Tax=Dactylosporangium sp. AC04546 TaxID=2862460 RepID=UPI001EDD9BE1|nr:hypothetical protein [Dactylosporangium sp. AC04546]WVK82566.1 hypothetical protein KZZ52_52960 [Dactylosporangium sp. AC04546]
MKRLIYPARRAVEHAVTVPGVQPLRLFPVLWPLWQVEISANVYEEPSYEIVDHFLVRAVAEAGLDTGAELARFLALPVSMVQRCLAYLALIGHVRVADDRVTLTELGARALRDGVRYEPREARQLQYFEQFTGRPLTRAHHDGAVTVLPAPEVADDQVTDGSRFLPLFSTAQFRPELVTALAARPDRAAFNVPSQLHDLRFEGQRDGYLAVYLIETAGHGLLAYTAAAEDRDTLLERVCAEAAGVGDLIEAEGLGDPRRIWTDWLRDRGGEPGLLRRLPSGVWRATFAAAAFGDQPKLPVSRAGTFQLRHHHFLQLWCDDARLRRQALLERALGVVRLPDVETVDHLDRRVQQLAHLLEVAPVTVEELRAHAVRTGAADRLPLLDALTVQP